MKGESRTSNSPLHHAGLWQTLSAAEACDLELRSQVTMLKFPEIDAIVLVPTSPTEMELLFENMPFLSLECLLHRVSNKKVTFFTHNQKNGTGTRSS
jgi:hypothetical protein